MMKFSLKILIVCIFALMPQILKADLNFFERFFFSNKGYAKHIDVKMYILTESQAAALLADPSKEPVQMLASELSKFLKIYLVVRVKNLEDSHAWGTLACSVPRIWEPVKVPIISIYEDYSNYLISIDGTAVAESFENFKPKLSFKWDELYTK